MSKESVIGKPKEYFLEERRRTVSSAVKADTPTLEVGEEADNPLHEPRSIARPTPHT
ncbi:hypothetical protein [Haladaptatus sp. CMAA 1911]|uniref:hypothetical protein n=1 Tax=unclassified Haladaptatus TaxID=2622732 RepID=UPI0037553D5A